MNRQVENEAPPGADGRPWRAAGLPATRGRQRWDAVRRLSRGGPSRHLAGSGHGRGGGW
jgi:hypothetical protein